MFIKIYSYLVKIYIFCNSDPVLVRLTEQIFMELSKNPGTMVPLQQRLIPTLVSILQAQPLKVPLGLQAVSSYHIFIYLPKQIKCIWCRYSSGAIPIHLDAPSHNYNRLKLSFHKIINLLQVDMRILPII